MLRHVAEIGRDFEGRVARCDVAAGDADPAGGRTVEAGDRPQQCRLAGAVRPHHGDQFARPHFEIDVVKHAAPAESGPDAPQANRRRTAGRTRIGRRRRRPPAQGAIGLDELARFLDRQRQRRPAKRAAERRQGRQQPRFGPRQRLARRTVGGGAAGRPQRPQPIGVADDPFQPVFGEDDRQPEIRVEAGQRRQHRFGAGRVELAGRLVEGEDARLQRQRRRDRDALPLAAGKRRHRALAQRRDVEQIEHRVDSLPHRRRRHAELFHAEGDFVVHPGGDKLRFRILKDEADDPAERARPGAARVVAGDHDLAADGDAAALEMAARSRSPATQQGRFAAAGRPGDERQRAIADRPIDIMQRQFRFARIGERNVRKDGRGVDGAAHGATNAGASKSPIAASSGRLTAGAVSDGYGS